MEMTIDAKLARKIAEEVKLTEELDIALQEISFKIEEAARSGKFTAIIPIFKFNPKVRDTILKKIAEEDFLVEFNQAHQAWIARW